MRKAKISNQKKGSKMASKQKPKLLKKEFNLFSWQGLAFVAIFGVVAGLIIWQSFAATAYTLSLNETNPKRGDTLLVTGTFPKVAFVQAHNPQFHQNPYLSIQCGNATSIVMRYSTSFFKSGTNPDGSLVGTATAYLLANSGNGITWPDGASAACTASSGYWTYSNKTGPVYNSVANLMFSVTP